MANSLSQIIKRVKASEDKIITPRLDRWLIEHPEGITVPKELMPVVERLLSSPNSDRSARFGASARGTCQRRQVFTYLGMPALHRHDPVLQNLFNDGTWRHIRWQLTLLIAGILTDVEVVHALHQYNVKVSTDGENTYEGWGMELKGHGFFAKVFEDGIPPFHMQQVHTYFIATGYDTFVYIGEDKRTNNWVEYIVHPDKKTMATVKDELNALSDAIEDEELPAVLPACRAKKGADFNGCPFRHQCLAQREWPEPGSWG